MDSLVWIDNHCHLDDEEDPGSIIAEAHEGGVTDLICVGVTVQRSAECVALASQHERVWATAGVHPHDADDGIAGLGELVDAGRSAGVLVAIGECGLDHHYDHSSPGAQADVFAAQIGLAHESELPLVIHTRDAWEETFAILDREGMPEHTVFHCFTGGVVEAEAALDRGALLSISGIATFPSARELRDAVAGVPLESLMVETDSPYLSPVPLRGSRNRPVNVARVGEEVAALKGIAVKNVSAMTVATTRAFYGLDQL